MTDDGAEVPKSLPVYAVRLCVQAQQDAIEAAFRFAELTQDTALARKWAAGLYQAVGKLATNPRGYVVAAPESRLFGRETRQLIYRRSAAFVAYRVLFAFSEQDE